MNEDQLPSYSRVEKPWGGFEQLAKNEPLTVKIITVRPEELLSLQTHEHRDEFWRILSGAGTVTIGEETHEASPGCDFFVPRGTAHRAKAGAEVLTFLELSFGDFDEEDIVRLEDKYGRA